MTQAPWVHIVGGGLAGLSLARELARYSSLPGAVVISEAREGYQDDRTFSFWCQESQQAFLKPQSLCPDWRIGDANQSYLMRGHHYSYATRSSIDFYDEALGVIADHPAVEWRRQRVEAPPQAKFVFDSRPPSVAEFRVVQSFHGMTVQLERPHGLTAVGLMEDLQVVDGRVRFRYVVPLGANQVLIEHTEFSGTPSDLDSLQQLNKDWCISRFANGWTELRQEQAHIPMGIRSQGQDLGIPIGTRGGMARDSTGYSYVSIQRWAQKAAHQLVSRQYYTPHRRPAWEQWMDQMLLRLIEQRPDCVPNIFCALARNLSADAFARFMMNQTPMDALRIVAASPKKPFVLALAGRPQWI